MSAQELKAIGHRKQIDDDEVDKLGHLLQKRSQLIHRLTEAFLELQICAISDEFVSR